MICTLALRTITRGGKEERAHFVLDSIRSQELFLWNDEGFESGFTLPLPSRPSKGKSVVNGIGRKYLELEAGGKGRDFKLQFDLQTDWISDGTKSKPLRKCGLSLRTPNIEQEYILSITVHCSKASRSASFFAFRSPVQILAGDFDFNPEFEAGPNPPVLFGETINPPLYEEEVAVVP